MPPGLADATSVAFRSRDRGAELAIASSDGLVHVYLLRLPELPALAHERLVRWFTPDECRRCLHQETCLPSPGFHWRFTLPDYGREIKFGYFLIPNAVDPLLETAQEVERLGLDYVAVQDHPYQRRFVDTWTLLSMIASRTSRVGLFPDVANLPLRPPAMMAKAAATIDLLSGGRFELGLGAGGFWDAIEAYGGPRRSPGEALEALAEAIEVIRLFWSGERNLRFEGNHYRVKGAHSGPVPAHKIGIWLGVYGPKALHLAGQVADGWVPSFRGDLGQIASMSARLDESAAEAGRDPASIRRILNVNGEVTDGASHGMLRGPVDQWVDELTDLAVTYGFDTFILWAQGEGQLARFAEEVAPGVRAQVAGERK